MHTDIRISVIWILPYASRKKKRTQNFKHNCNMLAPYNFSLCSIFLYVEQWFSLFLYLFCSLPEVTYFDIIFFFLSAYVLIVLVKLSWLWNLISFELNNRHLGILQYIKPKQKLCKMLLVRMKILVYTIKIYTK